MAGYVTNIKCHLTKNIYFISIYEVKIVNQFILVLKASRQMIWFHFYIIILLNINIESVKYACNKDANQYSKMYEEIKDIRFPYLMFIDC